MLDFKINGGKELIDLLDQVPRKFARNVVRGGARAAAVVVRDEAKRNVRRRSGKLARSLKVSVRIQGTLVTAKVASKGDASYRAPWIEYGVKAHWIVVAGEELDIVRSRLKGGQRGSTKTRVRNLNKMVDAGSLVIGGNFVGPYVRHPGSRAYPFLRPALDTKAAEAINTMGTYMAERLSWGSLQAPAISVEGDEA